MIVAFVIVMGPADKPLVPLGIVISVVILFPFVLITELFPKNGYLSSDCVLVKLSAMEKESDTIISTISFKLAPVVKTMDVPEVAV